MDLRDGLSQMRIAGSERTMLQLADRDGLSSSDIVRLLIRRAHASAFGPRRPKAAKKRKTAGKKKGGRRG